MKAGNIREALLNEIAGISPGPSLQSSSVLQNTANKLGIRGGPSEQAILTQFSELFRTGYLAWGYNLSNPNPPFFHLTEQGRRTLAQLSGDPGNPDGYLRRVNAVGPANPIARAYLEEALSCYVSDLNKASAVMLGASAESLVLELRDEIASKIIANGNQPSNDLKDWRLARILRGLKAVLDGQKLPSELATRYESFWPAFTQQIRSIRNEAGHPQAVDPITPDTVHAALLVFPELLRLAIELRNWAAKNLK